MELLEKNGGFALERGNLKDNSLFSNQGAKKHFTTKIKIKKR